MSNYQIALAIGAIIVSLASIHRDARAVAWVGFGALSFILSTQMWRIVGTGDTWPAFFAGLLDASVAVFIIAFHKRQWERYLVMIFQGMILVNFAYLTRLIGPHSAYVIALEVLNWVALGLIGGRAVLGWIGYAMAAWGHPLVHIDRFIRALERERQSAGFLHRAK